MDDKKPIIVELQQAWQTLCFDVKKNKKLKLDMFVSTFSQTYALLAPHTAENTLQKDCARLAAEAYVFAGIQDETLDSTCLAAFVLTDRMLHHCAFHTSDASDATVIYVFEARKEVVLNFSDANESIGKLTKIFDNTYWERLQG